MKRSIQTSILAVVAFLGASLVVQAQLWVSTSSGVTTSGKIATTSSASDALSVTGGTSIGGNVVAGGSIVASRSANTNVFDQLINASTGNAATSVLRLEAGSAVASLVQYGSGHSGAPSTFEIQHNGNVLFTQLGSGTFTFAGGRINSNASQPSVKAYNSSNQSIAQSIVTTVQFDIEFQDNTSNFASNVFTAPATGDYMFCAAVLSTGAISKVALVTSNRSYELVSASGQDAGCVIADLDASDTASLTATGGLGGGTVVGQPSPYGTYLSIRLMP